MKTCLNCGAELKQIEGSREKKYCNDLCRAKYHQKKNKGKEPKYVRYSTFKELKDKLDVAEKKLIAFTETDKNSFGGKEISRATVDEVGTWEEQKPEKKEAEYNFSGEKLLSIEKYTLYPVRDTPKHPLQAGVYLRKKKEADDKIRKAWVDYQKKLN